MAACRQAIITFCHPGCSSGSKPILRSRIFSRMARSLLEATAQGTHRYRPDRLYRDAARSLRLRIRPLADLRQPADLLGRRRDSVKLPALPAMRILSSSRASARTLGLGAEVAIAPDWTARIEYLYDRFGTVAGVFPSGTGYRSVFDIQTLRFGLNYKLGVADAGTPANAGSDPWPIAPGSWNVHGQFTFIEQGYPAFHSPYEGAEQSLRRQPSQEHGERHRHSSAIVRGTAPTSTSIRRSPKASG